MPPSGFSKKALAGLLLFVQANYEDLLIEVKCGKHPDFPTAIKKEIGTLEKALVGLHVNKNGNIVAKTTGKKEVKKNAIMRI